MAELHTLPGGGATPPVEATLPRVAVNGWDSPPMSAAVIVNPAASRADLANWAAGQLRQLNGLLCIVGCMKAQDSGMIEVDEFAGCIRHFTEQAEAVLQAAGSELHG